MPVKEFLVNNPYRADFPLLANPMNGKPLVYIDNGATTQKPREVLQAVADYQRLYNANPHRGAYELSTKATDIYETARRRVQKFINAPRAEEIVFAKNATEALNLVSYSYGLANVEAGDEIVLTVAEHHSNLVPWQFVAKSRGATLKYIYLTEDGNISPEEVAAKITARTKIVAVTQVSNVLGLVNDVKSIAGKAHEVGAVVVVDGSQSVPHMKVDVKALDADFFVFSGHKMLAPMGIGVLYGRYNLLDAMPPFLYGGDMIEYVAEQETTYAELPAKFEAGTQNVDGAAGLVAAIDYIEKVSFERIEAIERGLIVYAMERLRKLPFIELYGADRNLDNKTGIIAFNVRDIHPHDVATILDSHGIAIRAGHHCANPLLKYLGVNATCRASFYLYNNYDDVDRFIAALKTVRGVLGYE